MGNTTFVLLLLGALLMAFGPVGMALLVLIRSRFERGPVSMTYRDANGVEHTDTVDPENVESIGKFLSRVRTHTSEAADIS